MRENVIIGFVTMSVCLTIQCVVVGALGDLLVFLEKGAMEIASRYQLSDYVSNMVTGIILSIGRGFPLQISPHCPSGGRPAGTTLQGSW